MSFRVFPHCPEGDIKSRPDDHNYTIEFNITGNFRNVKTRTVYKRTGCPPRPHGQRRRLSPLAKTKSIISLKRSSIRAPYRRASSPSLKLVVTTVRAPQRRNIR